MCLCVSLSAFVFSAEQLEIKSRVVKQASKGMHLGRVSIQPFVFILIKKKHGGNMKPDCEQVGYKILTYLSINAKAPFFGESCMDGNLSRFNMSLQMVDLHYVQKRISQMSGQIKAIH